MKYTVLITRHAEAMLREIREDRGVAAVDQLRAVILSLEEDPELKTVACRRPLAGFRSLHSGRFRVIVRVVKSRVVVYVVGVGWHESGSQRDVYELVARAIRAGIIDPERLR